MRAAAARRRRAKDPEAVRAYKRAYYAANTERERRRTRDSWNSLPVEEQRRRTREANAKRDREAVLANARVQKAKRRGAPFDDEALDYAAVLLRDPCSYCGQPATTIDHIVAINAGGDSDWGNLTAACGRCNGRKQGGLLLRFLARM
jgi:5-methylcytosine-specific restriction endonuclease McrA